MAADQQPDKVFDIPYLMRDLDNGLRVVIVATDYPDIVTIQIPVQTGARNEVEPGKTGFAHFFEHMMFRGTDKYPADIYLDTLNKAGAYANAETNLDFTNYHIRATKDDLEKIVEMEADRFANLNYSEDDFRTEALAIKGEYLKNHSDPLWTLYERLYGLAFDVHTYQHLPMGLLEDIEAMPDQFEYSRVFFDRWYRPEKTTVIIVGDLDPEATFELVRKYWGGWERGDYEVEVPVEPPLDGPRYEHIRWESPTQPWLMLGFRAPAFRPDEKPMPALQLLSAIYFSESSDLYRKLVIEEQWVDRMVADFPNLRDPGLLDMYVRLTDAAHAAAVREAIDATLVEARTQLVDARRLAETKSRQRYSFTARLDSSVAIGAELASYVHYFRTPETINEFYATYETITAEDIRRYANEYLTDSGRVTVTLSPEPALAGIDGGSSVDDTVAAAGMASAAGQAGAASVPAAALPVPEVAEGVPVQFVTRPSTTSPLVDVTFLVHAGAAFDPAGKKGLATLTARMLADGGSEVLSIDEINAAMYPIASSFATQVDKEMTRFAGQVHKDNLDAWYSIVRGQLLFPAWSEDDFRRIRTQVKNAIATDLVDNNDEELGKELLYTSLYGPGHPYGSLNLGNISDIESITLEDVKAFYRQHYTVANMTVGLSGGYPESFPVTISNDLQRLETGKRKVLSLPAAPMPDGRNAIIVEKETPGVAVSFGFPIELKRGDPDWVALWLARSYLGEHRVRTGRLFNRIRELRGMNYGDYAYVEYYPDGMSTTMPATNLGRQQQIFQVWIRPVRNNNDAQFATRVAIYELDRLAREGMSESAFEATRQFLSKYVSQLTDGQARHLGYALDSRYYGIEDFPAYVRAALDDMTLDDVNRVIRENLGTDDVQYVFVTSDAEDLRQRLVDNQASPISYNAEKPQDLLDEDKVIESLPLEFAADKVKVVDAEDVFR